MALDSLQFLIHRLRLLADPHRPSTLSDAQLLERFVTSRDQPAFELLVWRHGGMVLSLLRRQLSLEQDVEDAFQATFLTLVRKAAAISKRESLGSWLYKVAYRIALASRVASADRRTRQQTLGQEPICRAGQ